METKVIKGEVHFKKKRLILFKGELKTAGAVSGSLKIVKYRGNTYVILPIGGTIVSDGLLIPIVEDYDSL